MVQPSIVQPALHVPYTYFTPGPTQPYPSVPAYMQQAVREGIISMAHRGKDFNLLFEKSTLVMRLLMNIPSDYHIFFVASATEAMERILQGTVEKNSLHVVTGVFSERMYLFAKDLKKEPQILSDMTGALPDISELRIPDQTELISFTHSETSTGVMTPLEDVYRIKKANPHVLTSLDIVSSAPYVTIDFKYIDCAFLSFQKGFGLPAGLAAMIVSPQAVEKATFLQKKGQNIGAGFHNLVGLQYQSEMKEMVETPNILGIYLLGKVGEDMLKTGIEAIRKQTEEKKEILWNFFDSKPSQYSLFVKNAQHRAPTVTVVDVSHGSTQLIERLKEKGFMVGFGVLPGMKDKQIRITNFPAHSVDHIQSLLKQL